MLYVVGLEVDELDTPGSKRYCETWNIMFHGCPKGFTPKTGIVMSEELVGSDKYNLWVLLESNGKTEQEVFDAGVHLIKDSMGGAKNDLHFK